MWGANTCLSAKNNQKKYDKWIAKHNLELKNYIDQHYKPSPQNNMRPPSTPSVYFIPVVFHVVHLQGEAYGTGNNLSYLQLQSQLDALNAAFNLNYPAYNGQTHSAYATNTNIRFCLARTAAPSNVNFYTGPLGTEYGVMRYADNTLSNHSFNSQGATALLGLTHPSASYFPFSDYLNIWVVSNINTGSQGITMGYGTPPGYPYPLNGIVMRSDIVGDNSTGNNYTLGYNLQQGKILVHEAGHWLDLRHIFEGGCAGANAAGSATDACDLNGDCICDIEPSTTQNIACNQPIPNTCTANYQTGTTNMDMIESYMSYADDDCMNTFTNDQTQRMWACLNLGRTNLWSLSNLGATGVSGPNGCNPTILFTNISGGANNNCMNSPIAISNPTVGNTATSWTWTAVGSNPSSANTPSLSLTYTAAGLHTVVLSVSDGTTTITDSVVISVSNCSLDPNQLHRSNWLFGDYASVSFATGQPVPNNLALVNNTIKCFENAVSMSDSAGNLLFYSNGRDLWDSNHQQVNSGNLFGWDLILPSPNGYNGTSVGGFMSFPAPKQPGKYYLVWAPSMEIKQDPNQTQFGKIAWVIYDAVANTVSGFQNLTNPVINYVFNYPTSFGLSESINIVPHCNGVDYWIIARGLDLAGTNGYYYSFLVNENGLTPNAAPVISGPFPPSLFSSTSDFKSNPAGDKIVCKTANKNIGSIYDFDASTGLLSNPTLLPSSDPNVSNVAAQGIIFSPDGQYIYSSTWQNQNVDMISVANNSIVKTITPMFVSGALFSYFEIGPDNIIYMWGNSSNGTALGKITNPNSPATSTLSTYMPFTPVPGTGAGSSILNFMEANKPAGSHPILAEVSTCSAYGFSLNPCWKVYSTSWNFGDGSPASTNSIVTHNYASAGIYTVSLTLSHNNQNIPVFTKTIQVVSPGNVLITGPSAICLNNPFLNSYGVTSIANATYSWSASNATIAGLTTLNNASASGGTVGVASLSVLVSFGGCNITATKTISIVDLQVSLNANPATVCAGHSTTLTGTPSGGSYSGASNGPVFTSAALGTHTINYAYTSPQGCYKTTSISILVKACGNAVAIENVTNLESLVYLYPNPASDVLYISTPIALKYQITNPLGQVIAQGDDVDRGIETASLSNGLYFVTLTNTANVKVELKFIKK